MAAALPALSSVARTYADTSLTAVRRGYPNHPRHQMNGPDDLATPSELHPAFYGCFDWHSAVEMHWALARLARLVPADVPVDDVAALFDEHLSADNLRREADYLTAYPGFERPYGWGWALALADDLTDQASDDPRAARWVANLAPLADTVSAAIDAAARPARSSSRSRSPIRPTGRARTCTG